MKYLLNLIHKYTFIVIILFVGLATLLHVTNIHFPCINSDEASFAYNAYSILKTGKDEYGITMPSRFKAFGENKLPVTVYSIVPSLAVFGLNDVSSRLPFILLGIMAPVLFYFLAKEAFGNTYIALIAAGLAGLSPWIQVLSRHIHEATIIMYLGSVSLILLIKLMKKFQLRYVVYLALINGIALFTYHIAKVFTAFYFIWLLGIVISKGRQNYKRILMTAFIFLIPVMLFFVTEFMTPTNRVSTLLFTSNQGFTLSIDEMRRENPNRLINNKLNQAVKVLTKQYISYFSPEFLVIHGDTNKRFGYEGVSPITIVEYVFILIGLYFLFARREKERFLIVSALLFAPISAALTWQEYSITRSFFMIVPIILIVSYGMYHSIAAIKNKSMASLWGLLIIGAYLYFVFFSWEFYFYHYPVKTEAIYGWQCGYKEMTDYVQKNYDTTSRFYITKKLGQPYIFTLFFLKYPPEKYQKQAHLSSIGEYGFGEVDRFDKFEFNFANPTKDKKGVYIGYPDDFQGTGIASKDIEKIKIYNDEVFWIYNPSQTKR